ncbi:MAG: electron transfer flavoprotein subunit beta/FixA family protein [Terracidiphilus sp.]
MRILAIVRQAPDAGESLRIKDGNVDLAGRKLVIDTMDEYGVEEALRLRESGAQAEIVALAVGPPQVEEALRTALAMGADRAVLVETANALDAIALSSVVAQIAAAEKADLILCGGQQADWDSHALGPAIAERLGWPQATWTSALSLKGDRLVGVHDADDTSESFEVALPAVVTTQQGLNEPRYPTLPNIMRSRKKELRREALESFGVTAKLRVVGAEIQVKERLRKILDGKDAEAAAAGLVQWLREEARVIA